MFSLVTMFNIVVFMTKILLHLIIYFFRVVFLKIFFDVDHFLESLLSLLQYCFYFMFWFFGCSMWDLRSLKVKVTQLCPTLWDPMYYTVYGILQVRIQEWVAVPFSRGSSQPRVEPKSPVPRADSLPAEPQGKPKNTGVGSLSLLQQIFLTSEFNQGLLHCRWILYQVSHQGISYQGSNQPLLPWKAKSTSWPSGNSLGQF